MTANSKPIQTPCPCCGVGCGVRASRDGDRIAVRGDPVHPANLGHLGKD